MMAAAGALKHVPTDPALIAANKRERRRGAAGRAAALRRAPSDSDCSGETASLSADSGEKRPPVVKSSKTRGRRRGSEWEVLEGLKEGQRFDRRPEVFNGYLHKKRKWPLKGWHKRFFVVDGGILVYARSPTDVARGRLHGSVDVGLSVISAKARRRRIDIDADEFIYHLRAKTADVFRTWLNVLKVHRLYRQHLLTFGARESMPKVNVPLENLQISPAEASSHTESEISTSTSDDSRFVIHDKESPFSLDEPFPLQISDDWGTKLKSSDKSDLLPLSFGNLEALDAIFVQNHSLCSMNCVSKRFNTNFENIESLGEEILSSMSELIHDEINASTNAIRGSVVDKLEFKEKDARNIALGPINNEFSSGTASIQTPNVTSKFLYQCSLNPPKINSKYSNASKKLSPFNQGVKKKRPLFLEKKTEATTLCFLNTKTKRGEMNNPEESEMKKSMKCTNLVRYKKKSEPTLHKPLSRGMILGKSRVNPSIQNSVVNGKNKPLEKVDKGLQDKLTVSECDNISEKLMISILNTLNGTDIESEGDLKKYINEIVTELYDSKLTDQDSNIMKRLFRSLLHYWLKNTALDSLKDIVKKQKSVQKPSNLFFTKDEMLSGVLFSNSTKETQHGISTKELEEYRKRWNNRNSFVFDRKRRKDRNINDSFEKEKRIQELERLLKNTVYVCETVYGSQSKVKDVEITKKLLSNLSNLSKTWEAINSNDKAKNSDSSTEFSKIKETLNHLISDVSLPADVAKDFLGAYLDVLMTRSSGENSILCSMHDSKDRKEYSKLSSVVSPKCEIATEAVHKAVSKNITAGDKNFRNQSKPAAGKQKKKAQTDKSQAMDPGQMYLKDLLDKITTMFTKPLKTDSSFHIGVKTKPIKSIDAKMDKKNTSAIVNKNVCKAIKEFPEKRLIRENKDENAVVIDLSKYDLEHMSMLNDPAGKGMLSITIDVKEKQANVREPLVNNLSLKFSPKYISFESGLAATKLEADSYSEKNLLKTSVDQKISFKNPYLELNQLNPGMNETSFNSDATSKAFCRVIHESENSVDFTFKNHHFTDNLSNTKNVEGSDEGYTPCFMMTSIKSALHRRQQSKKELLEDRIIEQKDLLDSHNSCAGTSKIPDTRQDLSLFDTVAPQVIDEKFILMLLENLTLLSKNTPTLHKDINALYLKLKKRHEKLQKKISQGQGLGLLGQIYNEEQESSYISESPGPETKSIFNKESANVAINTQNFYHKPIMKDKDVGEFCVTDIFEVSINTEINRQKYELKNVSTTSNTRVEKEISSTAEKFVVANLPEPTKSVFEDNELASISFGKLSITQIKMEEYRVKSANVIESNSQKENLKCIQYVPSHLIDQVTLAKSDNPVATVEIALSCPQWDDRTENRAIATTTNCLELQSLNTGCVFDKNGIIHLTTKTKKKERKAKNVMSYLKMLTSSIKISTTVQTEEQKRKDRIVTKKKHDFKVYQLFFCKNLTRTSSMTDSNVDFRDRSDDLKTIYKCTSDPSFASESGAPLENLSRELNQAQLSVQQLQRLLDALEMQQPHHDNDVSLEGASPNVKKDRRKFGLRKKKSTASKCSSVELAPTLQIDPSFSHSTLSALTAPPSPGGGSSSMPTSAASLPIACAATRPQSLPGAESLGPAAGPASLTSLTPDHQLREDFTVLAKDLVLTLKGAVNTLVCERGRLRAAMETAEATASPGGSMVAALRTNLNTALQQNSELRSRLSRIHDTSDLAEVSSLNNTEPVTRPFHQSLSFSSSCVSASEFFDAEEHDEMTTDDMLPADEAGVIELDGDSSSEAGSLSSQGTEGSASQDSDNSDGALLSTEPPPSTQNGVALSSWSRRTRLPSPRPNQGGPSLWNLLYKNIGKDLSQISMPVTINEPLNMLQRLCEELEYSELLDAAAQCPNSVERMALISAFAVSAYAASAHRAASKPFNPLLAETYECVRDDRGFRFISEQVSHHPPISACHVASSAWSLWQEARIKTKFWGKSMEFQPAGRVHVRLHGTGDHYSWNKVTTCVHNLFGGQRWVDQYGDMTVTCHGTDINAKLNFVKASSWSSSRHEVRGAVTDGSTGVRLRLQGRWSEALYAGEPPAARCLWRPGAMPPDHELYYGFTRFAMELNELEPNMRQLLPPTDTRLRPDQRALEEGDIDAAERYKHQLEQAQRERRRDSIEHTPAWFRKSWCDGDEMWVFGNEYWKAREAGFVGHSLPELW